MVYFIIFQNLRDLYKQKKWCIYTSKGFGWDGLN
jgi:hypothetical protein